MSSGDKLHQKSLKVLSNLLNEVQPIIDKHIEQIDPKVAQYLLTNYSNYLKINIEADLGKHLEQHRLADLTRSPFDDLLNDSE
jgi:hypothetical protein